MTEFQFDGGLLDICIYETNIDDWQKMADFIRLNSRRWLYTANDEVKDLPSVGEIFKVRPEFSPCLTADIAGVELNSHFFAIEEIDFDIDPRQVKDAVLLSEVFRFLRGLSTNLEKEVVVSPEGMREFVIFRITPYSDVVEHRMNHG